MTTCSAMTVTTYIGTHTRTHTAQVRGGGARWVRNDWLHPRHTSVSTRTKQSETTLSTARCAPPRCARRRASLLPEMQHKHSCNDIYGRGGSQLNG